MEITYTLEPADVRAFRLHGRRAPMPALVGALTIWLCAAALFLWFVTVGPPTAGRGFHGLLKLGLVASDLAVTVASLVLVALVRRSARSSRDTVPPDWQGELKASITPDRLCRVDGTGEAFTRWRSVHSIRHTEDHLFVRLHDGTSGFVVPLRAFASRYAAQSFRETAQAYWQEAQTKAGA